MTGRAPLLSFILLSYNYEHYIGQTIESILNQTVQDFEIVVVDDASSDKSVDRIRGFTDPRIRLIVNQNNLGPLVGYNHAVDLARGEWLVNLDTDDWIAPQKLERQLAAAATDPRLDIIGTYMNVVDASGGRPFSAAEIEAIYNRPRDFQKVDCWIGENGLCRSSTIIRRAAQLRVGGFSDLNMTRAWDYELWTRALREGCRFGVVPEPLTYYRVHFGSLTHGDPLGTLLEISYLMLRNLVPLAEARALTVSFERIIDNIVNWPQLSALRPIEAYRLLGMFMTSPQFADYAAFKAMVFSDDADPALARAGRRCLTLARHSLARRDADRFADARDFWAEQSAAWKAEYRALCEKPVVAQYLGVRQWMRNRRVG